jgi:hypothetical protein
MFTVRWTGFEPIQESGGMRIRMRYPDNWTHEQQLTENAGIIAYVSVEQIFLSGQEIEDPHLMRIHLIIIR